MLIDIIFIVQLILWGGFLKTVPPLFFKTTKQIYKEMIK